MVVFIYDKTFEGLLTAVFDAYSRKSFPDALRMEGEPLPLFCEETVTICSDSEKADRVWKGLEKKMSKLSLSGLTVSWLSALDHSKSIEMNFGDPDVLQISKVWKKVSNERLRIMQFLRFQKALDGTYFSAVEPIYNVLPLVLPYLNDRFGDQKWLIYDMRREYGYYYDLKETIEVRFEQKEEHLLSGFLNESLMDKDEKLFQQMWKEYFKTIAIKERINPKLHRQHMPVRFWKYMTEKQ